MMIAGEEAFLYACLEAAKHGVTVDTMPAHLASEPGAPSHVTVGLVLLELIDANLKRLPSKSSADDLRRCESGEASSPLEIVALHARIRQREQLGRWRMRVCHEHRLMELPAAVCCAAGEFLYVADSLPDDDEEGGATEAEKADMVDVSLG